jgi:hypothetical protein
MSFRRTNVQDFSLANSIYIGATVHFYTVAAGVATSTLATLYTGLTGSETASNPQTLDSEGKLANPIYHDVDVIAAVSGLSIPNHSTGIIQPGIDADDVLVAQQAARSAAVSAGMARSPSLDRYHPLAPEVFN